MPRSINLWKRTVPGALFAFLLPAAALALPPATPALVQDEEADDQCVEAINNQDWDGVLAICEPLVESRDDSHPTMETYKPNVDYAYQQKCTTAAQASDWVTTLATCGPTLERYPDFFAVHLFLGLAHQDGGNADDANAAFEAFLAGAAANPAEAGQLAAQIALARKTAANNYLTAGDRTAAIPLLRALGEADPTDAESHFRLGYALLQEQDTEGAEGAFAVVIGLNPDIPQLPGVLFRAGQIAFNAQRFDEADTRLTRYLEVVSEEELDSDAHWMLAFIAGRAENQSRMVEQYRAALAADPDDPRAKEANYSLGAIAFNAGQCSSAERYFRRFLRLAGNDPRNADVNDMILDIEDGVCEG